MDGTCILLRGVPCDGTGAYVCYVIISAGCVHRAALSLIKYRKAASGGVEVWGGGAAVSFEYESQRESGGDKVVSILFVNPTL